MESIKFRVWDNVLKTYIGESYGDPLVLYDVFDETHNYNEKNIFIFFNKKTDRFFIETYIKLRDKNNREIFEGDIIKLKNDDRLYTVEYVKEFCAYFLSFTTKGKKNYIPLWQNSDECEIIGNIHKRKKDSNSKTNKKNTKENK